MKLLEKKVQTVNNEAEVKSDSQQRSLLLHFLYSPVRIIGEQYVEGVEVEKNELKGQAGHQKALGMTYIWTASTSSMIIINS